MENKYKDKFYKLNKLYEQIKGSKKELSNNIEHNTIKSQEDINITKEKSISILEKLRNDIEYNKLSKEEQNIYDVYLGNKTIAQIKSNDLKDIILLERGDKRKGAIKIISRHGGVNKTGGLSTQELLSIGKVIRDGKIDEKSFSQTENSIRYAYDLKIDGITLRALVEEFNDGRKAINFYSDRNFKDYGKGFSYNEKKSSIGSTRPPTTLNKETIANPSLKETESINITQEVDFQALNSFAEPLEKSDSILKLVNDFKDPIKTPIGELKINMDYMLNKAIQRDGGARIEAIGYIKPTLERPAYIIEVDNKLHFIKPFIDEKDNTKKAKPERLRKKFLSVIPNRDNDVIMITSTIIQDRNIQKIVKDGEMIRDFTRLETGSTELAPVPVRADLNSPKASNSIGKPMEQSIASQNLKNNNKNDMIKDFSKADIISTLQKHRAIYQERPYTKQEWDKLFPNNKINTPIGEIVFGKNQFEKLDPNIPDPKNTQGKKQDRRAYLDYIYKRVYQR